MINDGANCKHWNNVITLWRNTFVYVKNEESQEVKK